MSKPWRTVVARYKTDDDTYFRVLSVSSDFGWEWLPKSKIQAEKELFQDFVKIIECVDASCQTEKVKADGTFSPPNVKDECEIKPISMILPSFNDLFTPMNLSPYIVPTAIHKINFDEQIAIVSFQNSSEKQLIDLKTLMEIDPVGVAKFLTTLD